MEIKDVFAVGVSKQNDRVRTEQTPPSKGQRIVSSNIEKRESADGVEMSTEVRGLQRSGDEVKPATRLLTNLPDVRAHVMYEARAKLRAGAYSSEEVVSAVADKLLESGEFDDIIALMFQMYCDHVTSNC